MDMFLTRLYRLHNEKYNTESLLLFTMALLLCRRPCTGLNLNNRSPKLTEVPPGLPTDIIKLNLRQNEISTLGADNFTGLTSMEELDLGKNVIAYIDDLAFLSCVSLTKLNLEDNRLVHMPATYGPNSQNMSELKFQDNPCIIEVSWFQQFRSLEKLEMDGSEMEELHNDMFNGLLNLKDLLLKNSKAPNLTDRTVSLTILVLSDPTSNTFPDENFMNLDHLTSVTITGYELKTTLPRFLGATALASMLLFGIETLPDLSHLTNLRILFMLSTQSLVCDHRLCWALFKSYSFSLGVLENGCPNPPAFSGRSIHSISKLELGCYESKFLHVVW